MGLSKEYYMSNFYQASYEQPQPKIMVLKVTTSVFSMVKNGELRTLEFPNSFLDFNPGIEYDLVELTDGKQKMHIMLYNVEVRATTHQVRLGRIFNTF